MVSNKTRGKNIDHDGSAEELSGDDVWRIFEDREGNVWVHERTGHQMREAGSHT